MTKQLILTNDIAQVPLLAAWVDGIGEELQLPPEAIFQLNLALEEAVVNVMNYAYPGEIGRPVTVTAKSAINKDGEERVIFTLIDEGVPFDPTKEDIPDITLSAEKRKIGGLGIFLVEQMMESVAYQRTDTRNVLTMIYHLRKENLN